MDSVDRKSCVFLNREWHSHTLRISGKTWQIYEKKGLVTSSSLWEKKIFLRVKHRGWIEARQGSCLLGSNSDNSLRKDRVEE